MSAEQTPDIAAVLAEHEWTWQALTPQRVVLVCSCGDRLVPVASSAVATLDDHRAHVAAALAPVLAAAVREAEQRAWYEGWNARTSGRARDWRNPYRADRITEPASHEAATSGKEASKA